MSVHGSDLDLTRPAHSGVYFVDAGDLDVMAKAAVKEELCVRRIDLTGCHDKAELLRRLAISLSLPDSFGHNWDALADCLRDLSWLPEWGHALVFDHADDLRQADENDFDILLGILDDAATFAREPEEPEESRPFFVFLNLPDHAFQQHDVSTA
ncbi:MAG: barstar family protein [Rhodanobacter sp.]